MHIRLMTQKDVGFAVELATNEGWISENNDVFHAFLYHDPNGCFIAEDGGTPVGVCVATVYDKAGFFGELLIDENFRGRGYGTKLLKTAIDFLKKRGVSSIYLDATPKAVPLYERAGFRKICASLRFQGNLEGREDDRVRAMRKWDLDLVCDLDRKEFGADRHFFLKWISFIGPDFAKVLVHDETITGYITGRYSKNGITMGPCVISPGTKNPECLLLSMAAEAFHEPFHLGVLETNKKAVRLFQSLGFREKPIIPIRMVLGDQEDLGMSPYCLTIGSPAKG